MIKRKQVFNTNNDKTKDIKWKSEFDAINKYIDNKYIYDVFYNYGFTIDNKFIKLDSNINVYEACFISLITKLFLLKNKNKQNINLLEIGFAFGTSALIFMNQLKDYKYTKTYDIVDMNQSTQWNNIGIKNLKLFIDKYNININYNLYEKDSTIILPKLKNQYDIIFVDGGHTYDIVKLDLYNSDKLLKINGIIILDDVLHYGVKKALTEFLYKNKNYRNPSLFLLHPHSQLNLLLRVE